MAQSASALAPAPKTSPSYWNARRRVYAVWAVIVGLGFVATQYYQNPNINGVWTGLSIIGLGYMTRVMKLKVRLMRNIFTVWAVTIVVGIAVSGLAVHSSAFAGLVPYLGVFWLVLLGLGHWANGVVDPPSGPYWASGALQIASAVVCLAVLPLLAIQYVVAGAIGALAMIWLILYR